MGEGMRARSKSIAIVGIFILWTCVVMAADDGSAMNETVEPTSQGKGRSASHRLLCMDCHTPDSPLSEKGGEYKTVLWNREETRVAFDMYVTLAGNKGDLDGPSKLCLSCHDGVTAPDHYGGESRGSFFFNCITGPGADLTDDHPIGIQYPPRNRRGTLLKGFHNPPRGDVKLVRVKGVIRVECTSCHDPHGSVYGKYLRESLVGSALCFNCHDK